MSLVSTQEPPKGISEPGSCDPGRSSIRHDGRSTKRIAYFINLFPNFIETMIYREVGALTTLGETIFPFSIRRPATSDVPTEAKRFIKDTYYILPITPLRLISTHLRALFRYPLRYCLTLLEILTGTHTKCSDRLRSLCHFVEAVTVLPVIERLQIEHIHAHWAVGSATCAMVISRFLHLPFTFTAHAYDIWRDRILLPEKLRAAQLIMTCTDYNRRHLAETYGIEIEKFRVVYHGVDLALFQPRGQESNAEPIILSVGRLVEQKGFDRLLRACAHLAQKGYQFQCQIIGDGPLCHDLKQLAQDLGLNGRVKFHGRIFQEQLVDYYSAADVFVLPCIPASDQDRDGIPNTLIEAMAMQVPVVSTCFSGIPELVVDGSTGLLVEPDDVLALAEAMAKLLEDPDCRRRMGQDGRQRVLQHFTVQGSASKLQGIFAALASPYGGVLSN